FEGFVKTMFGTDRLRRYEGMINTPLGDSVYLRVNFLSNEQDGIVKNVSRPAWNSTHKIWDLGERNHQAGRAALLWEISPDTRFQFAWDLDDLEQAPPMAVGGSEFAYNWCADPFSGNVDNEVCRGIARSDMYG